VVAAYWVTDGIDRCCVGYVDPRYYERMDLLQGRLGQVVEFLEHSRSAAKISYSDRHDGVCRVALIDEPKEDDSLLNSM